jgi:hypothetical protein
MSMDYKVLLRNAVSKAAAVVGGVSGDGTAPVSATPKHVFTLEEDF